jgi:nitrogenase molybdenum-iron protein alpha/beta subunit
MDKGNLVEDLTTEIASGRTGIITGTGVSRPAGIKKQMPFMSHAGMDVKTIAKTLPISAGGFEGDFHEGYSDTLCKLIRELVYKPDMTTSPLYR